MNHRKHTAAQNAAAKSPSGDAPRSYKQNSQGRYPNERPLTGEDRPADRSGGKQRGPDNDALQMRAAVGSPEVKSQGLTTMPPRR